MLPREFEKRMQGLLGADYPAFYRAMTKEAAVHGCRVNRLKMDPAAFAATPPFAVTPIPYTADGFYHGQDRIGHHPYHHAGILYSQDPGAMSALCAPPIQPGWRVLDVCAAPGGKSGQIAAAIGEDGVLVANEYVPSRAKLLVGNLERLGVRNAIVTNTDSATLGAWFDAFFDLTVVDAPCSGEGMFRKNAEAQKEWSPEAVLHCAARQREILSEVAGTVRPGGYLLYSTCTFALEENEMQVADFLAAHPDFSLCEVPAALCAATAPGVSYPGCPVPDIGRCRRFYPHIAAGEGQFLALLQRTDAPEGQAAGKCRYRDAGEAVPKAELPLIRKFLLDVMGSDRLLSSVRYLHGSPVLPPAGLPIPPHGVFAAGCLVGEVRRGVLFPHHQLFTTHGSSFLRKILLTPDDVRTEKYLHGDVIPAPNLPNGYAAVLLDGCTLGGAKVVDGVAKNLYPKGLRRP